jgi:hypothetical protein
MQNKKNEHLNTLSELWEIAFEQIGGTMKKSMLNLKHIAFNSIFSDLFDRRKKL